MSPVIVCPKRFTDPRGWFSETWNSEAFGKLGLPQGFCQDNQSFSKPKGTLRGLHYQVPPNGQAKLVRCLQGRIFDVAVDIRKSSPTFGHWIGVELSGDNGRQLFVPVGYAHGFLTLEENCMVAYKVDAFYSSEHDKGLAWDDPTIRIDWPLDGQPLLSAKDAALPTLAQLEVEFPYDGKPLAQPREVTP